MSTIKSYTDIEQSRELEKILPKESADMGWYYSHNPNAARNQMWVGTKTENADIPCWSLAVLLNALPNALDKEYYKDVGWYDGTWICGYFDEDGNYINNNIAEATNPTDACYEMILKLHELKIL